MTILHILTVLFILIGSILPDLLFGAAQGYYMSLSMYETDGFLSGWIIHALQDAASFSTLAMLG